MQGADLTRCRFVECRFAESNLSVAHLSGAMLQDISFVESKLAGVDWTTARRLAVVTFEKCCAMCAVTPSRDTRPKFSLCSRRDASSAEGV